MKLGDIVQSKYQNWVEKYGRGIVVEIDEGVSAPYTVLFLSNSGATRFIKFPLRKLQPVTEANSERNSLVPAARMFWDIEAEIKS